MSEENVAIVRRFYEEVFNKGNLDAADEFLATDIAGYQGLSRQKPDLEGFKRSLAGFLAAFPDVSVTLEDEMAVGDKVVVRWTDRSTHRGEFLGMSPTGREIVVTGISVFRLTGGKIVEQWTNWDSLSLMGQIGVRERPLQDLVGRMLVSQEEERRRVAYEVHDGLAQTAVAAHGLLEAYADNHPPGSVEERKALDRVLHLVRHIVVEARRVIGRLRPTALDDFGLAAAMRLQVEALRDEGWKIGYEESLGDERLPAAAETALFRVAQEALTNVRKHARTTRIRIKLTRLDRTVCLRVRDWGQGTELAASSGGEDKGERVGLYSMRERVALLGGDFKICSKPGAGTLIVARVPLREPAVGNPEREG